MPWRDSLHRNSPLIFIFDYSFLSVAYLLLPLPFHFLLFLHHFTSTSSSLLAANLWPLAL